MQARHWFELLTFVGLLALLTPGLGAYLFQVLEPGGRSWFDAWLQPVERLTYCCLGIDPQEEQSWKRYGASLLAFNGVGAAFTYAILRFQHLLPGNPEGLGPLSHDLAFNTAVSFITNTNWQGYAGESTLSHFSQMVALTVPNFTSATTGIAVAAALVRGIARPPGHTLGNFWSDTIRLTYRLFLPACTVFALFLVSQGTPQNLQPYTHLTGVEPGAHRHEPPPANDAPPPPPGQRVVQGPMASQVAIKMLGTNGGGFTNANAAHPFENPTPLSNFVQMLAIFLVGSGLTSYLGRVTRCAAHGWAIWTVMMLLFVAGVWATTTAEAAGNPIHQALGVDPADGNLEGKEVRFGIFDSTLFATLTTAASCGAVNSMHDSFTALGGLCLFFNMQLGEVIVGGVGAGLYGMLVFVVVAVFLAGLMVGRTPEYLGRKIQAPEIKLALLALLAPCLSIVTFAAWAAVSTWGTAGLNHAGPHGWSEMLYAFSSATANNGSAFAGLSANTPAYNLTLAAAMLVGRYLTLLPILALAGSLRAKTVCPAGPGTFPVTGGTFVALLLGTILLIGALGFLPALALGPIVEHFLTQSHQLF